MTLADLENLELRLSKEVERRKRLGGYSADAECLMLLSEAMLLITQHLVDTRIETHPAPKKK